MAACEACKEGLGLKSLLQTLGWPLASLIIHVDNRSTIHLAVNRVISSNSKHIEVRFHAIRRWVRIGAVNIRFVRSENQAADFLTKIVSATTLV